MPKLYSYDLRQKVIQAITLDGFKIIEASEMFSISCNTISLWLKRQTETRDCQAKPYNPPGIRHWGQKVLVYKYRLITRNNFFSLLP